MGKTNADTVGVDYCVVVGTYQFKAFDDDVPHRVDVQRRDMDFPTPGVGKIAAGTGAQIRLDNGIIQ